MAYDANLTAQLPTPKSQAHPIDRAFVREQQKLTALRKPHVQHDAQRLAKAPRQQMG